MVSLRWFLTPVLLLAAGQGVAKGVADFDSLRLVSAMREDERMLRSALAQKLQRTDLSEQDRACLDRIDYPEITDIVVSEIGGRMTAAEVRESIAYFQSSSGRKVIKRELDMTADVPFTSADQSALQKFKQRPAGRKLLRDFVLRSAAATTNVMARIDRRLKECAFRQSDVMRGFSRENCRARPVASLNNVCLATYTTEGSGSKPERASIEVNCRNDGRVLASRTSLPDPEVPVALRWSSDRELKVLVDGKINDSSSPAGSSVKVSFAPRQKNDPPPLKCVPQTRAHPTLAQTLPPNLTVGAWRAYRRPGLCLMTTRVLKKEVAGADGDVLLQFRRQTPAVPPFVTTGLALIVQIYQQRERPLLVDFGQKRLALIAHRPQQMHMLTGQTAEVMLQGLRSKPLELTVRRAGASNYSIPVPRLDFDFAYAAFSECLAALGNSVGGGGPSTGASQPL